MAPTIETIVVVNIGEAGASERTVSWPTVGQLKQLADEEERKWKREQKLKEMQVIARLKNAHEGIKLIAGALYL